MSAPLRLGAGSISTRLQRRGAARGYGACAVIDPTAIAAPPLSPRPPLLPHFSVVAPLRAAGVALRLWRTFSPREAATAPPAAAAFGRGSPTGHRAHRTSPWCAAPATRSG